MTDEEWYQCAVALESYYPNNFRVTDEAKLEFWFRALRDLDGSAVAAAIETMAKTQRAFPSVADIRQHVERGLGQTRDPLDAWAEALRNNHGLIYPTYRGGQLVPVEWSDPLVPLAIERIGGARVLAELENDQVPSTRARFVEAYQELVTQAARHKTFGQHGVAAIAPGAQPSIIGPVNLGQAMKAIGRPMDKR